MAVSEKANEGNDPFMTTIKLSMAHIYIKVHQEAPHRSKPLTGAETSIAHAMLFFLCTLVTLITSVLSAG